MKENEGAASLLARSRIRAWAFYDFANSAFTTLVVTFIYATWFTKTMAEDEARGTQLWSRAVSSSALLVAILAPLLGALADRSASRRRYFVSLTFICIASTATLAFVPPPHALLALFVFFVANVSYELAGGFYNAFLPSLSGGVRVGRISGFAWGLGYIGGLLCLALGLLFTPVAGPVQLPIPSEGGLDIRATNLLVALWFLAFSLPALLRLPEPAPPDPHASANPIPAIKRALQFPDAMRFLVARLIYNDGLVAIFAFGGIYAAGTFGMDFGRIILFGIWLNVAAGAGALAFGVLDDRIGGKKTVLLALVGLVVAAVAAALAPSEAWLWGAGTLLGLLVGPVQSASRSLMARFVPTAASAEFFGLYQLSGKLTAFAGPLVMGEVTGWTGNQRFGVASIVAFFVIGGALLFSVNEARGMERARAEEARDRALREQRGGAR